jgi:hypothetical protein
MKDDACILRARLERLLEATELAQHITPEDRVRIGRSIWLASQALQALVIARERMDRARSLRASDISLPAAGGRWCRRSGCRPVAIAQ